MEWLTCVPILYRVTCNAGKGTILLLCVFIQAVIGEYGGRVVGELLRGPLGEEFDHPAALEIAE